MNTKANNERSLEPLAQETAMLPQSEHDTDKNDLEIYPTYASVICQTTRMVAKSNFPVIHKVDNVVNFVFLRSEE